MSEIFRTIVILTSLIGISKEFLYFVQGLMGKKYGYSLARYVLVYQCFIWQSQGRGEPYVL